eukprot:3781841-Prymnesium_polylepis.1
MAALLCVSPRWLDSLECDCPWARGGGSTEVPQARGRPSGERLLVEPTAVRILGRRGSSPGFPSLRSRMTLPA